MRIGYIPYDNVGNAYTERTKCILSKFGEVCRVPKARELLSSWRQLRFNSYDLIIANWIDNCLINSKGGLHFAGVLKFIFGVLTFKLLAKRVIFVRHNNYPHHAKGFSRYLSTKIIDFFEPIFDVVVTHSGHEQKGKRVYVPHPLYEVDFADDESVFERDGYFFVFGRILPYKKLELLIGEISPGVKLIIAGSAPDEMYVETLREASKDKNVEIIAGFISDEQASQLARGSLGMVVSHHDQDMVVSGSFFYALSMGVPVFLVSTPFSEWLDSELKIPGVHVSRNLKDLCSVLEFYVNTGARSEVGDVEIYFGDSAVESGWRKVLSLR